MSLRFENLSEEKAFDHAASEWIIRYRYPGVEPTALVLQRTYDYLAETKLSPTPTAFERCYRELLAEKKVPLVLEKLQVPEFVKEPELTVEAYHALPAAEIAKRYLRGGAFRAGVDKLIKERKI